HTPFSLLSASWDGLKLHYEASKRFADLARGADALIYHMNTVFALDVAAKLGIPAIMAVFQPLLPTSSMPYSAGVGPELPKIFDPLTYVTLSVQQTFYDLPRYGLRPTLGLGRLFPMGFAKGLDRRHVPTFHAYPETVVPRPVDWPDNAKMT